jgi:hypothetical protein
VQFAPSTKKVCSIWRHTKRNNPFGWTLPTDGIQEADNVKWQWELTSDTWGKKLFSRWHCYSKEIVIRIIFPIKCCIQNTSFIKTPWQVFRPGRNLGGFERHLLTRVSWHIWFFTTDGRSAVYQSWIRGQPITDLH